jgi:uncharacterized protein (TIGR02452 family)
MNKDNLIKIFNDTVNKTTQSPITIKKLTKNNTIKYSKDLKVEVLALDTVSALELFPSDTCVLNMASFKRPGGGVRSGSMAQEEELFRCSNLHHISKDLYPLKDDEYLYSKDVIFIKNKYYQDIEPIKCDVITIAAPNLNIGGNYNKEFAETSEYETLIKNKMRAMLNTEKSTLILGAWGCGVFKNNPLQIAELFNEVIAEKNTNVKHIIFAVINDRNSVSNNYQIFKDTINEIN